LPSSAGALAARPYHPRPEQDTPFTLANYFLTSLEVGLRSVVGPFPREALARLVNPLSYPRYMEFDLALQPLAPLDGCTVLDLGSPKLPAVLVARQFANCQLYATDIRDYFVDPTAHFLRRLGLGDRVGRDIVLDVQDGRELSYADEFFDRVFSISVLEHIPDDGDSAAMREIGRVLKPGGRVTLTVPFCNARYWEEFIQGPVFERKASNEPTFYQRHYDAHALAQRLVEPSGLRLVKTEFFGEPGLRFEPYWNRIPMRWKLPLLWAQPFIAAALLKKLEPAQMDAACGAALTLEKAST
jgi:SAM-dependent methyltransferase